MEFKIRRNYVELRMNDRCKMFLCGLLSVLILLCIIAVGFYIGKTEIEMKQAKALEERRKACESYTEDMHYRCMKEML